MSRYNALEYSTLEQKLETIKFSLVFDLCGKVISSKFLDASNEGQNLTKVRNDTCLRKFFQNIPSN